MSLQLSSLFSVRHKTALVTGGATGLGFMMASALVQNGARVVIASRKQAQLERAVVALNAEAAEGGRAEWVVADVGSKEGCDGLVREVERRCAGGLDIVSPCDKPLRLFATESGDRMGRNGWARRPAAVGGG